MNKPDILISTQPTWVEKIFNKIKVIDVRKTKPKTEPPFKCLIYCTNNKSVVLDSDCDMKKFWTDKPIGPIHFYNGKIVGEFICDKIDSYIHKAEDGNYYWSFRDAEHIREIKQQTCLSIEQLIEYAGDKNFLYGWHISDLKIYDKPKELSEFIKPFKYDGDGLRCCSKEELENIYEWDCETLFKNKYPNFDFENCKCEDCPKAKDFYRLTRAPQSWCYVQE